MNVNQSVKREPVPWLQWMPNWLEFALIFGFTLWPFVFAGVGTLLATLSGTSAQSHLTSLLTLEAYALVLVAPLMYGRGWTMESLGLRFHWHDAATAIALVILSYAGYVALWMLLSFLQPEATSEAVKMDLVSSQFDLKSLVAAAIVNGFFEELFVAGYLIHCVRSRFGVIAAINVSVLVRLAYHLYQGPVSVVSVVPIGLVFAWAYVRTGRLWPLVIGHALLDSISLLQLAD
jgi:membrane protease YdiL (CAAX protease family)